MNRLIIACSITGLAVAAPVAAQTVPGAVFPGANGAMLLDQNRTDRQPAPVQAAPAAPPLQATDIRGLAENAASATALNRVRVEGSHAPMPVLERAFRPFIGRPLTKETVAGVAQALADAYGKGNVALYTIVVPRQDMADGVLTLRVVEGYIADVVITGEVKDRKLRLIKSYAARLAAQKPLRKPVLERYLSLIRDVPGLTVDVKLLNLPAPGAVRMVLSLNYDDFRLRYAINNRGIANLGRTQVQANLLANGLLRDGDQTQLSVSLPFHIRRYQYYALAHSTPIGTDGLRIAANIGYLRTRPANIPLEGEAETAGLVLSYPLKRGYRSNINLSLGLDGINSDNALFGQMIARDHTRAMRLAGSWSDDGEKHSVSAAITASQGADILGARTNAYTSEKGFRKLNAQLSVNRLFAGKVAVRLYGSAQLSDDMLPASEQFAMGGDQIGRAFSAGYVVGDRGYGGSAELALANVGFWPKLLKGSEVYGFADAGHLAAKARYLGLLPGQHYDLASAGGGIRLNFHGKTMVSLEAAKPIDLPYPNTSGKWRFIIGWRTLR